MWKSFLSLLFIAPAYSQVFTEDISKINHFIAEQEVERFAKNPTSEGIPAEYLQSLTAHKYIDPIVNCDDNPYNYKPRNIRYEVIAITEDEKKVPEGSKINVVVAKYHFHEEDTAVVKKIKDLMAQQANSPGTIQLKQAEGTGKKIVHFASPGTSIDLNTNINAENALSMGLDHSTGKPTPVNATLQVDLVNRLDIKQVITDGAELKGAVQSIHSTGAANLVNFSGMKMNLSTVSAEARLDTKLQTNVKSYAEVSYTGNDLERIMRVNTGFDIKASPTTEILVFSGYNTRFNGSKSDALADRKKEIEFGVKYKNRNGIRVFGRVRDGADKRDTVYETGIEMDLK